MQILKAPAGKEELIVAPAALIPRPTACAEVAKMVSGPLNTKGQAAQSALRGRGITGGVPISGLPEPVYTRQILSDFGLSLSRLRATITSVRPGRQRNHAISR